MFDIRTGDCVNNISCTDSVANLQFHNNSLFTVIKRENDIFWYDLRMGTIVNTLQGHSSAVLFNSFVYYLFI